jgi:hypothetical protein
MDAEQIKVEIAKLPARDRLALAEWILQNEDIQALRREEPIREIQLGVDEAERGDLIESSKLSVNARAALGNWDDFDRIMARVPDVPPMPGDER